MASLHPVSGSAEEILALLREWDVASSPQPLVIATSGSTGTPKRVVLSRDAMRASALATQARLGGPGQWVLNLPPTYVAGVQVLYRSVVAGTSPVTEIGELTGERTYMSVVPTQLVRAMQGEGEDPLLLARLSALLVGGGPLAPHVRAHAEGNGISVVQTYGMSETCGGCVYDGVPLDGVSIAIGADGEVLLRGPVLFDGYEDEPSRTAGVLRDGWFHTDDLGAIVDDRLVVLGRADDVILSGGVNVPARAVAAMILAGGDVFEAEVVGVPDDEWGERVVAVVAVDNVISLDYVRSLVEPRAWAPRQLVVVEQMPALANGKPDRLAIRELAAR